METFDFEKLEVWQRAVAFAKNVLETIDAQVASNQHYRLKEQIEAAACGIAMNIAEGKGRYSNKEFVRFLYYARGSIFETVTLLKIITDLNWIQQTHYAGLYQEATQLSKMLNAFIKYLKSTLPLPKS